MTSGRGVLGAIAAKFPATLFTEMDSDMAQDVTTPRSGLMTRKGSMVSQMVGKPQGIDPEPALQAGPITVLVALAPDLPLPPVLLAAGDGDWTISWRQSQRMATASSARANPPLVEFTLYPERATAQALFAARRAAAFRGEAVGQLVTFLARHLAP